MTQLASNMFALVKRKIIKRSLYLNQGSVISQLLNFVALFKNLRSKV